VDTFVVFDFVLAAEAFGAELAGEWFFAGVPPHVPGEIFGML